MTFGRSTSCFSALFAGSLAKPKPSGKNNVVSRQAWADGLPYRKPPSYLGEESFGNTWQQSLSQKSPLTILGVSNLTGCYY